jgi:hypothetical protein
MMTEAPLEVSWNVGNDTENKRARSRSLTESDDSEPLPPSMTENGIRLGTPVAREAAKSFWSMDMLKTSLNRMAFYADCENHSQGSLGSPDSGFNSRDPSARSTPKLPQITAPSTPPTVAKHEREPLATTLLNPPFLCPVSDSPLLVARREREAVACSSHSTTDSNHSTVSLSSSKTISPSLSAQALLPRRKQVCRSYSAEPRTPLAVHNRSIRGAHSDSSVYHRTESNPAALMAELRRKKLNPRFIYS